ncbi:MAG: hypothetical protein HOG03_11970 [Desulfobacula sp.]|jgi:hypothetical protein|uniref:hypothetical protein n=1 Tax=Desulfobacula sp. TaxID=2593537 RepID=UPI001DF2E2E3|nr:hypothetical protein [Desulfobacula sp.]MBT3486552.1 hypothetical protein [Desulfobacula sp.]MBT3805300.1 hypothetical protein [Desulfobacula sp.]MBT4025652.1 hypothetical protein [Desulfobacula sp.]MBT4197535.1 hypothetical protein [Desulfobacula sp.]
MNSEAFPNNPKQFAADLPVIIKSIIIVLIISCVLISPIRNISFNSSPVTGIDESCIEYLDKTLKRATIAYGLCRATNALVSVFQEIDIGFELVGTITFSPFEWLDPLNDLVERFSWILLAAMTSIGIQEFFIRLLPDSIINFIFLPGLFMWLTGLWANKYLPINLLTIGKHLVLLAVVLRFIIPAEVAINNWIYDYHLKNKYNQSVDNIKTSVKEIKRRTPVEEISMENSQEKQGQAETGFFGKSKNAIAALGDLGTKFKEFQLWMKTQIPILFENFISLILVFIISTIFLPIFILWLIVYLIRIITKSQFGHKVEKKFRINIF